MVIFRFIFEALSIAVMNKSEGMIGYDGEGLKFFKINQEDSVKIAPIKQSKFKDFKNFRWFVFSSYSFGSFGSFLRLQFDQATVVQNRPEHS
jgi:hypothetical protein